MRSAVHLLNSPRDEGIEFGLLTAKNTMKGTGGGGGGEGVRGGAFTPNYRTSAYNSRMLKPAPKNNLANTRLFTTLAFLSPPEGGLDLVFQKPKPCSDRSLHANGVTQLLGDGRLFFWIA